MKYSDNNEDSVLKKAERGIGNTLMVASFMIGLAAILIVVAIFCKVLF